MCHNAASSHHVRDRISLDWKSLGKHLNLLNRNYESSRGRDGPTIERMYGGRLPMTQQSVLMLAAKWWPLSARLAVALTRHGCRVAVVCPDGHPLTHVSGIHRTYRYAGVFSMRCVRRAIHDAKPEIIVPCDDGVVGQLHAIHRVDPSLRALIERSLGSPESYSVVRSRYAMLAIAKTLGVRVPETRKVTSAHDLQTWHAEVASTAVLKVDGESGGNGVRICLSLDDSLSAWRQLRKRSSYATALKRFIVDRNSLTLWQRYTATTPEVTVQEFVPGRPANSMMLCRNGELLDVVSVMVVTAESAVGAATVIRVIDDQRMKFAAQRLASRLQLSGFFGLDFMIDESGVPILIELNPRCTQVGHFELPGRGSLAGVFSASLRGEGPPRPDRPILRKTIALFPQALAGGALCAPYIAASYHDVPTEEPRLVRELERPSWPQRQWSSRLYHRFSPLRPSKPVAFEPPPPANDAGNAICAAVIDARVENMTKPLAMISR